MRIAEYDRHVRESDQYATFPKGKRHEIAVYGITSEIGSLVSAIKKDTLSEAGAGGHYAAEAEVAEEIGDIIWYCFSLAQIVNGNRPIDILAGNIASLKKQLGGTSTTTSLFKKALKQEALEAFVDGATSFPRLRNRQFDDYQYLAFKTARTEGSELIGVCLSVLWQLGAELMRELLPDSEKEINQVIQNRRTNEVLGEIAWHISAIASVYRLSLNQIIRDNVSKIGFRTNRDKPTGRHDQDAPASEQLPDRLDVQIVTIAPGISRMYVGGRQVGDDLTDNAYESDGYRFHDVMHLANIAFLAWSPVLRGLLKRKRKSSPQVDEVEDGARAKIVEEAVLKAIHQQGKKWAKSAGLNPATARLFAERRAIPFSLLKFVRGMVEGLEVSRNKFWEWEDAIYAGYQLYQQLREHQQGTVSIDIAARSLTYSPHVVIDLNGVVAGIGAATLAADAERHPELGRLVGLVSHEEINAASQVTPKMSVQELLAAKIAVLEAVGLVPEPGLFEDLHVTALADRRFSIRADGAVQRAIWKRRVVTFKSTVTRGQKSVSCSILAVGDPSDVAS